MLTATFIYSGMPDYWGGDGDRWDDNKGCLFAYYGHTTTVRDLVDNWVDDFNYGGDCDTLPEEVGEEDIRAALLAMLSPAGRDDYNSGALSEFAIADAEANPLHCNECGGEVGEAHCIGCEYHDGEPIGDDDCDDDCYDSPYAIVLIECEEE